MNAQSTAFDKWNLPDIVSLSQISAYDCGEFNHYIHDKMRGYRLKPCGSAQQVRFLHGEINLAHMSIDLVRLDTPQGFIIRKYDTDDIYAVQFPVQGQCEIKSKRNEMALGPGQFFIVNPQQLLQKHWQRSLYQVMLRINRRALERLLSEELGMDLRVPLEFDEVVMNGSVSNEFPRLIEVIWRDYYGDRLFQDHRIKPHIERTILLGLLTSASHNYRSHLDNITHAAPYYVKRAEEYMHENIGVDITTCRLVEAAGVSERSLYYGFKRWRNTTPMAYLRRIRLDRARQELQRAGREGRSITDVAMGLGYSHLSRFSKDYKSRFGETPSETLINGLSG